MEESSKKRKKQQRRKRSNQSPATNGPSPPIHQNPSSLERVPNAFNDDEHHEMDEEVLYNVSSRAQHKDLLPALLIGAIAWSAWSRKSFKDIRNLKILQAPNNIEQSHEGVDPTPYYIPLQRIVISNAWNGSYHGNYHEVLYANLKRITQVPYSNVVTIIQSSGSGKSRMVDNLANLVFTIPFNICEESLALAFPPPDIQMFTLLHQHCVKSNDDIEGFEALQAYYLQFLQHVFEEVRKAMISFCKSKFLSYGDLAIFWHNHLENHNNRQTLYASVANALRKSWRDVWDIVLPDFQMEVNKAFDRLSATIDDYVETAQHSDQKIKVVMYFDECHSLSRDSTDTKSLDVLLTATSSLYSRPFVAIFLSTNCRVSLASLLSRSSQLYPKSASVCEFLQRLQPPITETPFDCGPMLPLTSNTLQLEDTWTVEFLAQFGRPLFWTMIANAGSSFMKGRVLSTIIGLARSKLLCQNDTAVGHHDVMFKNGSIAVVDVRLMLDYDLQREAGRALEADLVASHMRTMFSIPQTWEHSVSGYPSEPLLAEAAAQQMHTFRCHDPDFTINLLKDNMTSGLLNNRQQCGELVARELLTSAYDRAIERESGCLANDTSVQKKIPLYSAGVSVVSFIEELYASPWAEQVLDSIPDNVEDGIPFREAFRNAKVRFTHFGKMADEAGVTSDAVWTALIRGMAIILAPKTCDIDLIIPVLLRADAKICEEEVTGILISVKQWKKKGSSMDHHEIDGDKIEFFPRSKSVEASRRPYISLVMELGVQSSSDVYTSELMKNKALLETCPQTIMRELGGKHPRYSIFAYGCSNAVYKGITISQQHKYYFLLGSRDFLQEHPRKNQETLTLLRQMKPFWKADHDFYDWIRDTPSRLLQEEIVPHWLGEGVVDDDNLNEPLSNSNAKHTNET